MASVRNGLLCVAACLAMGSSPADAQVTTSVVDIPLARGARQRILLVRPDNPAAYIVAIPGGDGVYGIRDDGAMPTQVGTCSPQARNRAAFAARGYGVVLVDEASDHTIYDVDDIYEVIRYVRRRDNVPVWVSGGSNSTAVPVNVGVKLPADEPIGALIGAPGRVSATLAAQLRRPVQIVAHALDPGASPSALSVALTSVPVKEVKIFNGGNNSGCGYHLLNGLDAEYVDAVSSFIDRYNGTLTTTPVRNYQGLWWASPAGSESGWGVNFAHQGDVIFATWFTYDATGKALWLTMTANKTGDNSYAGTMYRTRGPAFSTTPFDPAAVTATEVGSGTLTFGDGDNGTFAYTVDGISQTKAITRQAFGTLPACTFGGMPDLSQATNYQDLWWASPAESESGWGVNFTHQGDTIFATWFTYDTDGTPLWLSGTARRTGVGTYAGTLSRTRGPAFNAVPFEPSRVTATDVGPYTLTFANGNAGTFAYTANGVSQTKAIVRQVFRAPGTACR